MGLLKCIGVVQSTIYQDLEDRLDLEIYHN